MDTSLKLHGLVAAVHTPFKADGSLNPSSVDAQAKLLASQGIKLAFITGSTGESSSMQLEERKEIYSAWKEASAKHGVEVIAHTGSNSVWDARELASFAQECGFVATSSLAPSYYKPGTVQRLVECCAFAASGAPDLPYYYYDIPVLTGVRFNPVDFIRLAKEQIPNFAGIKFTNPRCITTRPWIFPGVWTNGLRAPFPWGPRALWGAPSTLLRPCTRNS